MRSDSSRYPLESAAMFLMRTSLECPPLSSNHIKHEAEQVVEETDRHPLQSQVMFSSIGLSVQSTADPGNS